MSSYFFLFSSAHVKTKHIKQVLWLVKLLKSWEAFQWAKWSSIQQEFQRRFPYCWIIARIFCTSWNTDLSKGPASFWLNFHELAGGFIALPLMWTVVLGDSNFKSSNVFGTFIVSQTSCYVEWEVNYLSSMRLQLKP